MTFDVFAFTTPKAQVEEASDEKEFDSGENGETNDEDMGEIFKEPIITKM